MLRKSLGSLFISVAAIAAPAMADEVVRIGLLTSHDSEVRPLSISFNDGLADYLTLVNVRDGGIDGTPVELITCETQYTQEGHMACYQQLAAAGIDIAIPTGTVGAYALNQMAFQVGVPVLNGGLGQTAVADGRVFPNSFAFPGNYYQAASAMVEHFEAELQDLNGKRIAYVYHDSLYGEEAIPLLQAIAASKGFALDLYPVAPPGDDQAAIWTQIAQSGADRAILWTVGRMTATSIGTAAAVGYPREQMMGNWWTTLEMMMRRLGPAADGMRAMSLTGVGHDVAVYNDLNEMVYFAGLGHGTMNNIGDIDYNRGLMTGLYLVEAARNGLSISGDGLTAADMREGLEALNFTSDDSQRLGFGDLAPPLAMTCSNHSGFGLLQVIEYDSSFRRWTNYGDYVSADSAIVSAAVSQAASGFADALSITPRDCPAGS
ncbi:ABC transporter substrate-binding protein [Pontivivens insulae]|uniref:Leucine-binding protein domain-containing protein n=1 Tax=Pontivivens insulae TaxID=1639689 RepID=A0A2R8ACK0_9RHOB|nr:ABC transporter substrate-binding protein [Pontivivens insulae]RED11025.1 branched-chain amino acid transport system substrate-binding protein [Pontivivens insulae]SPF29800.1 hypothetical protein POI8812_02118 [Pontivivens insulae]